MRKLFALLLVLAGCGSSIPLGPEWSPLREVHQAGWVADGMVTTIDGVVFIKRLSDLPTGLDLDALLTHEHVHAVDEQFYGMQFYIEYAAFPSVRWDDESRAWAAEIAFKRQHGMFVDTSWYAGIASTKYSNMIGYDQALAWFQNEATK